MSAYPSPLNGMDVFQMSLEEKRTDQERASPSPTWNRDLSLFHYSFSLLPKFIPWLLPFSNTCFNTVLFGGTSSVFWYCSVLDLNFPSSLSFSQAGYCYKLGLSARWYSCKLGHKQLGKPLVSPLIRGLEHRKIGCRIQTWKQASPEICSSVIKIRNSDNAYTITYIKY